MERAGFHLEMRGPIAGAPGSAPDAATHAFETRYDPSDRSRHDRLNKLPIAGEQKGRGGRRLSISVPRGADLKILGGRRTQVKIERLAAYALFLAPVLWVPTSAFAQSPFEGTWRVNTDRRAGQISIPVVGGFACERDTLRRQEEGSRQRD